MPERQTVGSIPDKAFEVLVNFLKKARKNPIWIERLEKTLKGQNPFEEVKEIAKNWLQSIVDSERKCHQDFFGRQFPLAEFTKTLKKYGVERIKVWEKLGLEPHFLPAVPMMLGDDYPGWKIKPEGWFYEQCVQGRIFQMVCGELQKLTTVNLGGITVLVDTRLKPRYGSQYNNDWLSLIIKHFHQDGKIKDFDSITSRFSVSAEETELVKVEAAKILGLKSEQLRLEQEIEANVIPQLYPDMSRKDDGKTNTWEWREEFFGGRGYRLNGGNSDGGGLADVYYCSVSDDWYYGAFRFLAVL